VQHLKASAGSYASIEAANTSSLRSLDASTGSLHASANAGALLPVNVSFREVLASLLLLLAGSFALAWQLLLLISHLPITF
jgi:hypothetical protein